NGLPSAIIRNLAITDSGVIYATSGSNLCMANDIESNFGIIKDSIYVPARNGLAVGANGLLFLSDSYYNAGIFRSTDYGINWTKVSNRPASSLSVFENKYIVTGHSEGEIMFSFDKGDSWTTISDGLPQSSIIYWSQIDSFGYLHCAASGFGLYKSTSNVTSVDELTGEEVKDYILRNNYPNPFNPTTTISYSLPTYCYVTLKVYDILGNEIVTLVDEHQLPGLYKTEFDANKTSSVNHLASGVYIYTLNAGGFIQSRKMILMK
ncbi:MAG: T9SS type A sorting domain-containing protein, partial [Ignavibacteriaceae bacterium]